MAKLIERGTNYAYTIERIKDITFTKLRSVVIDFTRRLPADLNSELYEAIQHGVCQLQSEPELNMYIHALGLMHEAKLQHAFQHLPSDFIDHDAIEIIDYGCGQAIGTICYADFLRKNGYAQEVRKITLIEPSEMALKRAALHTSCFFPNAEIITINKGFDDLVEDDFSIDYDIPTLHIFSNVLDLADNYFNLKSFAYLLSDCIIGINQFVCVEPYFDYDEIDEYPYLFFKFLNIDDEELTYCKIYPKGSFVEGRDWTCHIVLGSTYIQFAEDGVREEYEAERAAEEQRFEDAYKLYEISAKKGNADAYYQLGEYNYFGKGIEKNEVEAIKWYRKAAEQGHHEAQIRLGWCYHNGYGVTQDYQSAVKWYCKAAEQGNAKAQNNLGDCYYFGKGVEQDQTEAVNWYRKAAEQGNAEAQFNLGVRYANGEGVEQDQTEAVNWYRKAAEQGNAEAQFNLGVRYANGEGVEQDQTEAVNWYRKAAEQGNAMAQNNLGVRYANGEGVEQDQTEAVNWYRKAAEQGHKSAQFILGVCYTNGQGVEQDQTEAVKWYRKAAEQGHKPAQDALEKLNLR